MTSVGDSTAMGGGYGGRVKVGQILRRCAELGEVKNGEREKQKRNAFSALSIDLMPFELESH